MFMWGLKMRFGTAPKRRLGFKAGLNVYLGFLEGFKAGLNVYLRFKNAFRDT